MAALKIQEKVVSQKIKLKKHLSRTNSFKDEKRLDLATMTDQERKIIKYNLIGIKFDLFCTSFRFIYEDVYVRLI